MQNDNATVIISSALWDNRDADLEFQIALISLTPNCTVYSHFSFCLSIKATHSIPYLMQRALLRSFLDCELA